MGGDQEALSLLVAAFDRSSKSGEAVHHPDGSTATYRDPSGALLTIHKNHRGGLECGKPGFDGGFRARWRPVGVVPDPECRFCDLVYAELLDDDDEMVYPLALSVETIGADRALIPYGEPAEVRFARLVGGGRGVARRGGVSPRRRGAMGRRRGSGALARRDPAGLQRARWSPREHSRSVTVAK